MVDQRRDAFTRLATGLSELQVTVGPQARPIIAEVRELLAQATADRERGNEPAALSKLGLAMERLAALADVLDPAEGMLMRMIAQQFSEALRQGDKGTAKEKLNVMRRRAGDPKEDPNSDW
jgi:hypothetical protein